MEIGTQIKRRRQELNMTQEMLAKELNVGRTTVSNWESGRNYPDLQLIVSISNTLDLSLDTLLREESEVVKEISRDTHLRKSQRKTVWLLSAILLLVILAGLFGFYKLTEVRDVWSAEQIVSLSVHEKQIVIQTDLPFYRSLAGYTVGTIPGEKDTITLSLTTQIDLSFHHKEEKITVETESLAKEMGVKGVKRVEITNQEGTIKSFDL